MTPIEQTFLIYFDEAIALLNTANLQRPSRAPQVAKWLAEEFRGKELQELRLIRCGISVAENKARPAFEALDAEKKKLRDALQKMVRP